MGITAFYIKKDKQLKTGGGGARTKNILRLIFGKNNTKETRWEDSITNG
jgi:hypothetical protein